MRFQHPTNGHIETMHWCRLWAFLFQMPYFASKGMWGHAAFSLLLALCTFGLSIPVYALFARGMVRKSYLRNGWTELDDTSATKNALRRAARGTVAAVREHFTVPDHVASSPAPSRQSWRQWLDGEVGSR